MENPFDLLKYKATLKPADEKTIEQFKEIFPAFVIDEWRNRGFASYLNGLLMTTDPIDFYDVIEGWVDEPRECHVIMRTAFGSFHYLKDGEYYHLTVFHNLSYHLQNNFEVIIRYSLTGKGVQDNIFQKKIFSKASKRLRPVAYDEVYAFVPAIALGGDYNPDTMQKVKLKEHLAFLAQLGDRLKKQ